MKKKVCHIISDLDHSVFVNAIETFLDKKKYDLMFIFLGTEPPALFATMGERGHRVEFVRFNAKKDIPRAVFEIRSILRDMRADIVHTHMVNASLAGLIAARLAGIGKRVHTRHHASECFVYYPHGVYYDKLNSELSKRIVAISEAVSDVLIKREGVSPEKIHLIRHGLDLENFKSDPLAAKQVEQDYQLDGRYPVVGVISRFVHWKGVQYIIPAFKKLSQEYPDAKLVLANAIGNFKNEIIELLEENLAPSQYILIPFEPRVADLYENFDLFVHVPVEPTFEAYGLIYVEALAMKVPSVFTLSGIANEFIEDRKNALVVPHKDSEAIYRAMRTILEDTSLRERIVEQGKADVFSLFSGEQMAERLDLLYSSM